MLDHELHHADAILVLYPDGPLAASDFTPLAMHIDTHVEQHGALRGVLIRAQSLPGWKNFGAVLAHMKFVREHLAGIERVAVVTDGEVANTMPNMAGHFINAEVRQFDLAHEDAAWDWLRSHGRDKRYPGARSPVRTAIRS